MGVDRNPRPLSLNLVSARVWIDANGAGNAGAKHRASHSAGVADATADLPSLDASAQPQRVPLQKVLDDELESPLSYQDFYDFLCREHSEENLEFYMAVKEYTRLASTVPAELLVPSKDGGAAADDGQPARPELVPLTSALDSILATFFTSDGEKELNVPAKIASHVVQAIWRDQDFRPAVFDAAVENVCTMLRLSSFPSFCRSVGVSPLTSTMVAAAVSAGAPTAGGTGLAGETPKEGGDWFGETDKQHGEIGCAEAGVGKQASVALQLSRLLRFPLQRALGRERRLLSRHAKVQRTGEQRARRISPLPGLSFLGHPAARAVKADGPPRRNPAQVLCRRRGKGAQHHAQDALDAAGRDQGARRPAPGGVQGRTRPRRGGDRVFELSKLSEAGGGGDGREGGGRVRAAVEEDVGDERAVRPAQRPVFDCEESHRGFGHQRNGCVAVDSGFNDLVDKIEVEHHAPASSRQPAGATSELQRLLRISAERAL
ncbi:hypothetical protein DFJ73DRAFT_357142 [Zopfochytrium polystomum]|nr:hypothetical protein DFJ73DRAFT_357142 [Zopfochytrium polystomum]